MMRSPADPFGYTEVNATFLWDGNTSGSTGSFSDSLYLVLSFKQPEPVARVRIWGRPISGIASDLDTRLIDNALGSIPATIAQLTLPGMGPGGSAEWVVPSPGPYDTLQILNSNALIDEVQVFTTGGLAHSASEC